MARADIEIPITKKASLKAKALGVLLVSLICGFGFTIGEHFAFKVFVFWFGALG